MLIQDDFVAPKMSVVERPLQRSSWKAEAIRRGELKISGPIPITEETPLTEEEERQYAEKGHLHLHTQSRDSDTLGTQAHTPVVQQPEVVENGSPRLNGTAPDDVTAPEEQEPAHALRHRVSKESLRGAGTGEFQGRSSTQPLSSSYATSSPYSPLPRSSTVTASKKKKGGSLRNVFRKMFGRRSREEQHEPAEPVIRHSHHRSEPITIHESPKMTRENVSNTTRISDLPVRELEPINPLGQHLPFPMNVNAPQQTSPPHDYISFDRPSVDQMGRRATLPNILHHHAGDKADGDSPHSPQIGIALSSPPQTSHSIQSKRRSRSAGALRDLARSRPSVERRRSEEIRYWRGSYQSGSVYSTVSPRPQTARTVETVRTVEGLDAAIVHEIPERPESRTAEVEQVTPDAMDEEEPHMPMPLPLRLPVEAFNFGDFNHDFQDVEQPADVEAQGQSGPAYVSLHEDHSPSIEHRVQHLEDNLRDLETTVRRISSRNNRQTIILENAPSGSQYRNRTSPPRSDDTLTAPHHQANPSPPMSPTLEALSPLNGITTTTTSTSSSAWPAPESLTLRLTHLTTALQSERLARKTLEHEVSLLRGEITTLHAMVHKLVSHSHSHSQVGSPSYPTPSPDGIVASNEERVVGTPRAAGFASAGGGKENESPETLRRVAVRETVVSRFSGSDSERDDGSVANSSREHLASPEAWATPKEEGVGFFEGGGRERF